MVKVEVLDGSAKNWKGDALLIPMQEEDCKKCAVASPYDEYVKTLVKRKDFEGKKDSLVKVPLFDGDVRNLYLAGLGKSEDCSSATLRDVLTAALRKIGRERNKSVLLLSGKAGSEADVILGEAAGLCGYAFDKYKKKDDKNDAGFSLEEIRALKFDEKKISLGRIFADAQCFARDLANEPGNVVNPASLADIALRFAKEHDLTCEVWDEKKLEQEKMGALLPRKRWDVRLDIQGEERLITLQRHD